MQSLTFVWMLMGFLFPQSAGTQQAAPDMDLRWKAALMTGDDQIPVFDNARKAVKVELLQLGILPGNIRELSMSAAEQVGGTLPSSSNNLQSALQSLAVREGDACIIHLTSHGTTQAFFMRTGPSITPERLNAIVDQGCGNQPTVLLISACYSGVFVHNVMLKPNRIILTAARDDLTSFGCSAENQYTYWDGCLIDYLPKVDNWKSLYVNLRKCVEAKESQSRYMASYPQAYFGNQVENLKIPAVSIAGLSPGSSRCPVSDDDTYGVSAANAIKVGLDASSGPARELQYLNALRGPAGQRMQFRLVGSTMNADKTILDVYELRYDGIEKPIRIHLDEYHFEQPKAPKGFVCAIETGLGKP